MRQKRKAKVEINQCPDMVVYNPEELKGNWNKRFNNENPIFLEAGMGDGHFIVEIASMNPDQNFIGLEVKEDRAIRAVYMAREANCKNILIICADMNKCMDFFDENELTGIYINFPDPWPKKRHYKRRLLYRGFLDFYRKLLKPHGNVFFKTDNKDLYDFAQEEFVETGFIVKENGILHSDDSIFTRYEKRFRDRGMNIYKIRAQVDANYFFQEVSDVINQKSSRQGNT